MKEPSVIWLIIHLLAIAVAYGSVLIIDFMGLLWVLGKIGRERMIAITKWDQPVIWSALVALLVSGVMLRPDLSKPLTQIKMGLVLAMLLNGINLETLRKKALSFTEQRFWDLPTYFKLWSSGSILLSQALWISIILAGYMIAHRS